MNVFELNLDKTITKLAGNHLGRHVFKTQMKDQINYGESFTIVFPERIDTIASSFIQGFFEEIIQNIGIVGIEEKIEIISAIPNLKTKIVQNLL